MRVTVRMFARLRELSGAGERVCEVPAGATVADVWRAMVQAHPALEPFGRAISCARNAEFARMTVAVAEGDDIAFLPPVSGG
jgi:molybdopterin synthase sulfur carrier subunit